MLAFGPSQGQDLHDSPQRIMDILDWVIRWYYATEVEGELVYVTTGNRVPKSKGARELMVLPDTLPTDIDYDWYINADRTYTNGYGPRCGTNPSSG